MKKRRDLLTLTFLVLGIGLLGAVQAPRDAAAQAPPPLPPGVADLARLLGTAPGIDDPGADDTIAPSPPDDMAPVVALRRLIADVDALAARGDRRATKALARARAAVADAWRQFAGTSADLRHLSRAVGALHRLEAALGQARRLGGPGTKAAAATLQGDAAGIASRMAGAILRRAEAAGVHGLRLRAARRLFDLGTLAIGQGNPETGVAQLGGALALAASTITFDVALFEQNVKDALAGQTVGHAFSISYLGLLYQGGESSGLARTAADAPQADQSPSKEQHVASVSKTLTAIVLLRLLEDLGLSPETFVAPYLPGDWVLSAAANSLRFRHLLTHTSGLGQIGAGSDYASLQVAMGAVGGPLPFAYRNANFGLMRVLIAGLQGIDPVNYPEFSADGLTAAAFLIYARQRYNGIGVDIDCKPDDATPTVQYPFPDDGLPGYVEPDRRLTCGGYGWFISSNELANVLANLHLTENLLSAQSRALMRENFYGFMDPANYGFIGGDFGVYSMHGGDWLHGGREAHACAVVYPIQVEVGLVINSARGPGMPYQCAVLQTAFDDAWVAK